MSNNSKWYLKCSIRKWSRRVWKNRIEDSFEYFRNSIKLKGQLSSQLESKVFHLITIPLNINDTLMSKFFLNYSSIPSPFQKIIYLHKKKLLVSNIGSILDDKIKKDALALFVQNTQFLHAMVFRNNVQSQFLIAIEESKQYFEGKSHSIQYEWKTHWHKY